MNIRNQGTGKRVLARLMMLVLLVVCCGAVHAGRLEFNDRIEGSDIAVSAVLNTKEEIYSPVPGWDAGYQHAGVTNRVTLGIDRQGLEVCEAAFNVDVTLLITLWGATGSSSTFTHVLNINYDPASGSTDLDVNWVERTGGYQMVVRVLSISGTMPANVYLETSLVTERYADFDWDSPVSAIEDEYLSGDGELEVRWDYVPGAEEYELEWTFVSTEAYTGAPEDLEYNFRNNATRVTVSENHYRIALLYERGYIIYRLRAVGRQGPLTPAGVPDFKHRLEGVWNCELYAAAGTNGESGDLSVLYPLIGDDQFIYYSNGHEPDLNWQASMTFAEEGKHVAAISYHDGSLRGRQAVSKSTTEDIAVAGETYYDYQGRPAVQALPVPTFSPLIRYYENFNKNVAGDAYSREDFDLDYAACEELAKPFSTTTGAGYYYSSASLAEYASGKYSIGPTTEHYRAQYFTPEASGFPFVQTVYTPDPTGRVSKQTGAGFFHRLGSGHESRFFYGTPTQQELDRLFGTEVGYAEHYRKNMSIDANGQVAVSYTDAAGRTIATAMAGEAPASLIALDDNVVKEDMRDNLMEHNTADVQNGILLSATEILVTEGGVNQFEYEFTGNKLSWACESETPKCYDCIYDLEISVLNDCGAEMLDDGPVRYRIGGHQLNVVCDVDPLHLQLPGTLEMDPPLSDVTHDLGATLETGHYTVYKRLTIAEDALQYYLADFMSSNVCLKTLQQFVEEEMENIDTSGCNLDCADCEENVNPFPDDPDGFAEFCAENCVVDWCEALEMMILADLSPGGQYAKYTTSSYGAGEYGPDGDAINVLAKPASSASLLAGLYGSGAGPIPYEHPCSPYKEEDGTTDSEVMNSAGDMVAPEELTVDEFIRAWRPSWARSLMCYHPDNCYLGFCESLSYSRDFDTEMQSEETYDGAQAAGYLNALCTAGCSPTCSPDCSLDPFFQCTGCSSGDPAYDRWMELATYLNDFVRDAYGNPVSAWDVAASIMQDPGVPVPSGATFGADASTKDAEWKIYKAIYLSLKQEIEKHTFVGGSTYDNCEDNIAQPGSGGAWDGAESRTDLEGAFEDIFGVTYTRPASTSWLNALINNVNNVLADECASTCEAYRQGWESQLAECITACSLGTADVTAMLDDLQGVCEAGCDFDNPLGSSSTPLGVSYYSPTAAMNFESFDEVVQYYLPDPGCGAGCRNVLNFPMDYGHDYDGDGCDDAISYNLVINGDFESGVYGFASDLDPFTSNCDEDCEVIGGSGPCTTTGTSASTGEYTVAENAHCVSSTWEGKGYPVLGMTSKFMMVNSLDACADGSSSLIPDPVTGVSCAPVAVWYETVSIGTTGMYQFSAEVMNLQASNVLGGLAGNPVLALEITEGGKTWTLAGPTMLVKDPFQWHTLEGKVSFTTITTATIRIVNYNVGAQCNDFGVDHVQFGKSYDDCCLDCWEWNERVADVTLETGYYPADPEFEAIMIAYLATHDNLSVTHGEYLTMRFACPAFDDPNGPGTSAMERRLPVLNTSSPWRTLQTRLVGLDTLDEGNQQRRAVTADDVMQPDGIFRLEQISQNFYVLCPEPILPTAEPTPDPCIEEAINMALWNAEVRYEAYLDSVRADFVQRYTERCMDVEERFERIHDAREYQYTLYYYDQSGGLIQTVPPAAVRPNDDAAFHTAVKAYRDERAAEYNTPTLITSPVTVPDHGLPTMYAYNSLGQVRLSKTPDKGQSRIWYDNLGRPVMSQDARQHAATPLQKFSYTHYDALGRVTESGEMTTTLPVDDVTIIKSNLFAGLPTAAATRDVMQTYYDVVPAGVSVPGLSPQNLRNRVSCVTRTNTGGSAHDYATYYSYDEHGNVKNLVQEIAGLKVLGQGYKRFEYKYDLFSGNVHEATYQKGAADQWIHRYFYDANNRLRITETSHDGRIWDRDVKQYYYLHGALARLEIGTEQVQGLDFAGTILGWQKLLNSSSLVAERDMGLDGPSTSSGTVHPYVARDVLGYELGFFAGDYGSIQNFLPGDNPLAPISSTTVLADKKDLYNGNIAWWTMNQPVYGTSGPENVPLLKRYRYDQLNRIKEQQVYEDATGGSPGSTFLSVSNDWDASTANATNGWKTSYAFDNNGNLLTMNRNANVVGSTAKQDEFTYNYTYSSEMLEHNRLGWVDDAIIASPSTSDIEDQDPDNYVYDEAGNLIQDVSEGTSGIVWDMYGKIRSVHRGSGGSGTGIELTFNYGTDGNRVEKVSVPASSASPLVETERQYYVRDGSGNVIAIYKRGVIEKPDRFGGVDFYEELKVSEYHIYGGERVGIERSEVTLVSREVDGEGGGIGQITAEPVDPVSGAKRIMMSETRVAQIFTESGQAENHDGEYIVLRNDAELPVVLDGLSLKTDHTGDQPVNLSGTLAGGKWLIVARGDSSLQDSLLEAVGLDTLSGDTNLVWLWHTDFLLPDSAGRVALVYSANNEITVIDQVAYGAAGVPFGEGESLLRESYAAASGLFDANEWSTGGAVLKKLPIVVDGGLDLSPTLFGYHKRGWRMYELKDHLGNVHVVVSDRRLWVDADHDCVADYFIPDVLMSTDYDPYGTELAGRVYNSPMYRYGFNGKEKDDDFNGVGNMYDYGFRVYDPRIGRFLSVDPLAGEYPWYTPYQYAGNKVINSVDLDGLEDQIKILMPSTHFEKGLKQLGLDKNEGINVVGGFMSGQIDFYWSVITPVGLIQMADHYKQMSYAMLTGQATGAQYVEATATSLGFGIWYGQVMEIKNLMDNARSGNYKAIAYQGGKWTAELSMILAPELAVETVYCSESETATLQNNPNSWVKRTWNRVSGKTKRLQRAIAEADAASCPECACFIANTVVQTGQGGMYISEIVKNSRSYVLFAIPVGTEANSETISTSVVCTGINIVYDSTELKTTDYSQAVENYWWVQLSMVGSVSGAKLTLLADEHWMMENHGMPGNKVSLVRDGIETVFEITAIAKAIIIVQPGEKEKQDHGIEKLLEKEKK